MPSSETAHSRSSIEKSASSSELKAEASIKDFATEKPTTEGVGAVDVVADELLVDDEFTFTDKEARKVLWKIDFVMMPVMCITYMIQYLDKTALSYAALYGMKSDTHIDGHIYSSMTTLFYIGYLVAQYPAAYIMQKVPLSLFILIDVILWSAMVCLMAACRNGSSLLALRFLAGVFEASITPAFINITAMWYKRDEQPMRTLCWYAFNGVAQIIGSILSYGLGHIHHKIASWRYIFIVIGLMSLVWGLVFVYVPSNPAKARFLSPREQRIALERVRDNRTGLENKTFKLSQAWEAFRDPQVILITLFTGICMITNGIGVFSTLIINGLGYGELKSAILNMPLGAIEVAAMIVSGILCKICKNGRLLIGALCSCLNLVGCLMIWKIPQSNPYGRLVGVWFTMWVPAASALLLSLISSNVAGYTKKSVTNATVFVFYSLGNIIAPQLFKSGQTPEYIEGIQAMVVALCLIMAIAFILIGYYLYENKRRDALMANDPSIAYSVKNEEFMDLTDREQIKFRYRW
ncbi:membrane transporter [Schizosaccharomyces cryophilus OY26]|uniref:Membrane transporter n=1 Tax=Schizosaccharomyces cryophilus (strain OY26 / ATCC MYA-4695 / CBS 11777 / NBRC 106824 / NRRL Y48691) TaxID=653667 RepID=S9VZG8_SCHCR|nr:membrane transporter [Schizosaccharomyces cryophilus OY26]EPY51584.1 membrane transporter [Schizosaccharomyces cryophilus OY26]